MSTPTETLKVIAEHVAHKWAQRLLHTPNCNLPSERPIPSASEALDAVARLVDDLEALGEHGDFNALADLDNELEDAFQDAILALPPERQSPMLTAYHAYVQASDSDEIATEGSVRLFRDAIRDSRP